jgi:hypothetical protein
VESEGRQMKQSWILYGKREKIPPRRKASPCKEGDSQVNQKENHPSY